MKIKNFLTEDKGDKVAVVAWGRMGPPTVGHLKLINKVKEEANKVGGTPMLYLSHSYDGDRNPLPYESKIKWAQKAFGDIAVESPARTIIEVLADVNKKGYNKLVYLGGSDRIGGPEDITANILKYNGTPNKNGDVPYNFDSIDFVNAGDRDENSDDLASKASASLARKLVKANDFEQFKQIVPYSEEDAMELFKELQKEMKVEVNESLITEAQTDIVGEVTVNFDGQSKTYKAYKDGSGLTLLMGPERLITQWQDKNIESLDVKVNQPFDGHYDEVVIASDGRHVKFGFNYNGKTIKMRGASGAGRGDKGGFPDKIITAYQEVIMGLILNGQIDGDDIEDYILNSVANDENGRVSTTGVFTLGLNPGLPVDIDFVSKWEKFVKSWGHSFQDIRNSKDVFYNALPYGWTESDIKSARLLHVWYKDGKFVNKKDVFDKSDIYYCTDMSVIDELGNLSGQAYCELDEALIKEKKLLGVSLKRPSGSTIRCDFDIEGYNKDSFDEDAFCEFHYTKTAGRIKTVNLRFIGLTNDPTHYPILEVRSDSDEANPNQAKFAVQWKFAASPAWAGKGKEAFKHMFGEEGKADVWNAAIERDYIKCAATILRYLGVNCPEYSNSNIPAPDTHLELNEKARGNIATFMNLSMGFNGRDSEGNRVTAPYIKVY